MPNRSQLYRGVLGRTFRTDQLCQPGPCCRMGRQLQEGGAHGKEAAQAAKVAPDRVLWWYDRPGRAIS